MPLQTWPLCFMRCAICMTHACHVASGFGVSKLEMQGFYVFTPLSKEVTSDAVMFLLNLYNRAAGPQYVPNLLPLMVAAVTLPGGDPPKFPLPAQDSAV